MEKRLECFSDFILENTGKDTYFYLSADIVSDFFAVCKMMNYTTPKVIYEDYYDLSNSNCLETETLYKYQEVLEFKKVEVIQTETHTKILQIGEEQFELKLTKTAIEHLKLTGKCKIL